ncbi:MAG: polyprenol monophosphomannose synthase, partial [Nitrospinota bacterium]
NEAENIKRLIPGILSLGKKYNILVVDDNSPDGTAAIVHTIAQKEPRVSLLKRSRKLGLGSAYIDGIKSVLSDSDYIFEMDADLSHDYRDLPRFIKKMKEFDILIGSRYVDGVRVTNWSFSRLLLSYFGNLTICLITGLETSDNTSGFKCFKRHVLKAINLDRVYSKGFSFQVEMNYRAAKKNFKLGEIPIVFKERASGASKLSFNIVKETIWVLCKLRLGPVFKKR